MDVESILPKGGAVGGEQWRLQHEHKAEGHQDQHDDNHHEPLLQVVFHLGLAKDAPADLIPTVGAKLGFIEARRAAIRAPAFVVVIVSKAIKIGIGWPVIVISPHHGPPRHGDLGTRSGRPFDQRRANT